VRPRPRFSIGIFAGVHPRATRLSPATHVLGSRKQSSVEERDKPMGTAGAEAGNRLFVEVCRARLIA
jgi:hypothetical protein